MIGITEWIWIVIIAIIVIVLGKNSPKLARKAGKTVSEVQSGVLESSKEFVEGMREGKETIQEIKKEIKK